MLLKELSFAPDLPAAQHYQYIEACYALARYEWLIRWAETAERRAETSFHSDPFAYHQGPDAISDVLFAARTTLNDLLNSPDLRDANLCGSYELDNLATTIASWRGMGLQSRWTKSGLVLERWTAAKLLKLTDLSESQL